MQKNRTQLYSDIDVSVPSTPAGVSAANVRAQLKDIVDSSLNLVDDDGDKGDITVSSDGTVWTIDNQAVTLSKLADINTASFLGRATTGIGSPEVLTISQTKTLLDLTGINSGDQTITLQGDVTGTGTGTFNTTISNDSITFSKIQNIPTQTILGRFNSGIGDVENITLGDNLSLSGAGVLSASGSGGGAGITDGNKGDITVSGTGTSWSINNDAVTFSKINNISTATLLGRTTTGSGDIEQLSTSSTRTLLNLNNVENTALSTWNGSLNITTVGTINSGVWNGTALTDTYIASSSTWNAKQNALVSGTNIKTINSLSLLGSGDIAVPALTDGDKGDITVSASGSTWTINNQSVSYAKLQNVSASSRFLGRVTSGAGIVEELTPTQAKTVLAISNTDVSGLGTLSTLNSVDLSGSQATGVLATARFPALTGDITTTSGSLTTTISDNSVTLSKLATVATGTLLARTTSGTGNVESITFSTLKSSLSLNNVENTALSTWIGSTNLNTLGTVTTGVWNGTALDDSYISSASTWNAKQNAISLTVTGSSGASTFISNTLNIPTYTLAGLGGISLTSLSATSPLSYNNGTGAFTIQSASTSQSGALSSTDWNTFNNKESAITSGTTAQYWRGDKTFQTLNATAVGLGNVPNTDATNASNISSGTLPIARIGDGTVTLSKITNIATDTLLGRSTASTGSVETLTTSEPLSISSGSLGIDVDSLTTLSDPNFFDDLFLVRDASSSSFKKLPLGSIPALNPYYCSWGFIDGMVAAGGLNFTTTTTGTGATITSPGNSVDNKHFGTITLDVGTTSTGRSAIVTNSSNIVLGNGSFYFDAMVLIPTLSDGTNAFDFSVGLIDSFTSKGTDCVAFNYIHSTYSGNWECFTRNNSTETTVNSAITVAINTWYRLEILINSDATSAQFFINNSLITTITTNIPNTTARATGIVVNIFKSAGTTSRTAIVDYVFYKTNILGGRL